MTTFILPADYYPDAALAAVRERFAARAVVTFGTRGIDVEVCITTSDGPALEHEILNAALRWAAAHEAGLL